MRDPIVEEVRKYRDEHAKKFNYDLKAIFADIQKMEKESGQKIFAPPRRKLPKNKKPS